MQKKTGKSSKISGQTFETEEGINAVKKEIGDMFCAEGMYQNWKQALFGQIDSIKKYIDERQHPLAPQVLSVL